MAYVSWLAIFVVLEGVSVRISLLGTGKGELDNTLKEIEQQKVVADVWQLVLW